MAATKIGTFLQFITILTAVLGTWFAGSYEVLKWERDAAVQRENNHASIAVIMMDINVIKTKQATIEDFLKRQFPAEFPYIP